MDALLTALVVWLATNFGLPANFDHPSIVFVPPTQMTLLFREEIAREQETGVSATETDSEIVLCVPKTSSVLPDSRIA